MLLLDTSALIDLDRLELPDEPVLLSSLAYAELKFGVERAPSPSLRRQRIARLSWLSDLLGVEWLPFDRAAADAYTILAARVAQQHPGHARSKDIMIAGHALSLGARLVTLDLSDFALLTGELEIVVPPTRSPSG